MKLKQLLTEVYDIKLMVPRTSVTVFHNRYGVIGIFYYGENEYVVMMHEDVMKGERSRKLDDIKAEGKTGGVEFLFKVRMKKEGKYVSSYEKTDLGQQSVILPTIFWLVKKYINKYNPPYITYRVDIDEIIRDKVYGRFLNKLGFKKEGEGVSTKDFHVAKYVKET
jgi:hypothetical protein